MFSTIDQIGGFIYTIILSHSIGAEGIGMYQIATGLVGLIVAIAASGLPFVLGRRVAEFDALKDKKNQYASTTAGLVVGTVLSIVLCLFFLTNTTLLTKLTNSSQITTMCLFLLPAAFANSLYACFRGSLWGRKKYVHHSSLEIIEIAVRIALALVMYQGFFTVYEGTIRACITYSVSCLISAFISFVMYKMIGGGFANPLKHIMPIFKSGIPLSGIRLAGGVLTTMIALIFSTRMTAVGYTLSAAMAEYGVLTGMTLPLIAFPIIFTGAISTTLVPEISGNLKKKNMCRVRLHLKQAIDYTLLFGGLAIGVYIAFGPALCQLIFSNSQAGNYVRTSCWIMIPLGVAALTTNLQNSLGLEYKSLVNYFIGGLFMLLALWFLPKFFGAYALVIGTGVGMGVTAILNTLMICKTVNLKGDFTKTLMTILFFALLSASIGLLLSNLCTEVIGSTISVILCCLLCVSIFLILATVFNTANVSHLWKSILFREPKNQLSKDLRQSDIHHF